MWKRITAIGVGAALALGGAIMKSVVSIMALVLVCCTTPVAHAYPSRVPPPLLRAKRYAASIVTVCRYPK